jgi:hypothetical protein
VNHCCDKFRAAIKDEFINLPGSRLSATDGFSKRYFMRKKAQPSGHWLYFYIEYCPFCGQEIGENNE